MIKGVLSLPERAPFTRDYALDPDLGVGPIEGGINEE